MTLVELVTAVALVAALALAGVVAYSGYRTYADGIVREQAVTSLNEAVTQFQSIKGSLPIGTTFDDVVVELRGTSPKGTTNGRVVYILKETISASDYDPPITWNSSIHRFE